MQFQITNMDFNLNPQVQKTQNIANEIASLSIITVN